MSKELIKIIVKDNQQLVSARDLHEFLEVGRDFTTWIKGRISKYNFIENEDFTVVESFHQNGGKGGRPEHDYIITIDMGKELSMVENNEKGREARRYFIQCEKKLKQQTPTTYLEALKALVAAEEEKLKLQEANKTLAIENDLLSKQEYEWADAELINALVRAYGYSINDYSKAWKEFKKNLLYSYSININSRITNYLNTSGKKTKPKTLSMLKTPEEISNGVSTAISMCKENNIDISEILNHYNEQRKVI